MLEKINITEAIERVKGKPWQPIELMKVNESIVRLASFHGEYHWHKHKEADELFFVIKGAIRIKIKNKEDLVVNSGELVTIPKGVEHKPTSKEESYVLLFEPLDLVSTGD
jgi:mannose-6-phosphate isomerase-like protein (cupin superfamily)